MVVCGGNEYSKFNSGFDGSYLLSMIPPDNDGILTDHPLQP